MLEILQYPFMQRAFISGIMLAGLLSVLGVFVVLKRMAFFSDGISHASLAGVAIGLLISWTPLVTAIMFSILFSVLIFLLEKKYKIASDTAIGILFTSGMALGVLLMSFKTGYQPELITFLFGNILTIQYFEIWIIVIMSIIILTFVFLYKKSLILLSLDEESAYISGVNTGFLQLVLYIILAIAVVLGIKILGVVLVSALLIIPVSIVKIFARSFKKLLISSIIVSEIIVVGGIALSYYFDLPAGPTIVLFGTLFFIISLIYKEVKK